MKTNLTLIWKNGVSRFLNYISINLKQYARNFSHNRRVKLINTVLLKYIIIPVIIYMVLIYIPDLLQKLSTGFVKTNHFKNPVEYIKVINKQKIILENKIRDADYRLAYYIPKSYYLKINSADNEFFLYKNKQLVKQGKCSTGSYILLEAGEEQKWMFKTPKGVFSIHGKTTSPVWKKPDWAFIEEGLPVPPPNHWTRFEYGVLGDYALSIGHGYLIHGTLYKRFLGLPVTHGCIRLNDEDLELVYHKLNIGSRVYIY